METNILDKEESGGYSISIGYGFERRYCRLCNRYNPVTGYCPALKKVVNYPNEPQCSWFIRIAKEKQ
jgi:hypothetical protein